MATSKRSRVAVEERDLGVEKVYPQRLAFSRQGMVATAHYRATEAGVEALEAGGNAVDAAVAAAFALGVCEPAASGLGGQTMAILRLAELRKTIAVDGSSRAPNRATPGLLNKMARLRGHTATTVPSTPAVLEYLRREYGRLSLAEVLAPAIRLAEEGYRLTALQRRLTRRELKNLRAGTAAPLFLQDGERVHPPRALFRQAVLARTLRRLATEGIEDFYLGEIAQQIEADMIANGGLLQRDDLAQVPWPIERRPLSCRFDGLSVLTFPPPGAGRTLVEMLNILKNFTAVQRDPRRPLGVVLLCEVIRRAFLDRQDRPFDPNFYPQMQGGKMMSSDYARLVARQIRTRLKEQGEPSPRSRRAKRPAAAKRKATRGGATRGKATQGEATRGETTHLSVTDAEGNVVGLTQSIERVYGSFSASPELGFLYNNYMSAFEYEDISHPYYLRPNAAPWASVGPTILMKGAKPWAVLGSPGSERITPSILQVMLRLLDGQPPLEAVAAPRFHCSLTGKVSLEAARMRDDLPEALEKFGFQVDVREPFSFFLGCVQLVLRDRDGFLGVADPRRDGSARGPKTVNPKAPEKKT